MHWGEGGDTSSGWRRVSSQWPLLLGVVVLAASVVTAERAVLARTGGHFIYALDDAYIHMAVAKNLAVQGVWGCTPFRFASASSSPLWTVVLGLAYLLTGLRELTPLVLNVIFGVMTLGVSDAALTRLEAPALLRALALVGLVLVVPLPAMTLLGMEHVLHLLLTIAFGGAAALALADRAADETLTRSRTTTLSVLAALLAASRYEGLFPVALVCLACLALGQWRRGVIIGTASVFPLGLLAIVSIAQGSYALPNSLMLKTGGDSATIWAMLLRPFDAADMALLRRDHALLWVVVGGAGAAVAGAVRSRGLRSPSVLMPLLLALMAALHVHFALSSTFWVYRYDAYLLGFGVFAGAVVIAGAQSSVPGERPWALGLLAAAAMAAWIGLLGDVRAGSYPLAEIESASLTYREHYLAARFVHERRPGETVMVNDVGAMAFFSNGDVLDIFGLCNIEPVVLRRAGPYNKIDVEAWTLPYQPSLAVLQMSWGWVVGRIPDDWLKVAELDLLPEGRTLGFFAPTHDRAAADKLRVDVERFYRPLEGSLGYHLRVF